MHQTAVKTSRKSTFRGWKTVVVLLAAFQIIVHPIAPASAAASPSIVMNSEEHITAGAMLRSYTYKTERSGQEASVQAKVIQIDLKNPYVKLDVMNGRGGQFTKKNTILGMAQEYGAVAGTNGDFYNTQAEGVPIGPQITNGQVLATPPILPGYYNFAITKENKPVVDVFTFEGQIKAKDGAVYPLGGINKTYYWFEPGGQHSHIDGLFMYTHAWGQEDRSNDGKTVPTEVLVVNNVVTQIAENAILHMVAPQDGYILRAAGKAAEFVMAHIKVGDTISADYAILPQDPTKAYDTKNFKMMVGGHTIMVDEGKPSEFSRDLAGLNGYRARTAIGYSKDERYVYLITADSNGDSKGLSMKELQDLMVQAGVWRGLLLDGGGSTQMVARPQGETGVRLINAPEYNYQRPVVNGLGVFTLAPKGQVLGMKVEGPRIVFLGEKVSYALKAYDEYYNPVLPVDIKPKWGMTAPIGILGENNTFQPVQKGKATLNVTAGKATTGIDVQVVGRDDLTDLKVTAYPAVLLEGSDVTLKVTARTKDGSERQIPAEVLNWDIQGIKGTLNGNILHVDSLNGAKSAQLLAKYDGYNTTLTIPTGVNTLWTDFDKIKMNLSFSGTEGVTGTVSQETTLTYWSGNYAKLNYDFSKGTKTKAAYANFGGAQGADVPGSPQAMQIQVKGDNSLNWLRAEFIDADGDKNLVDLAKAVNWSGWKTLTADLSAHYMTYPVRLTRIYAASIEQGQDERALTGSIAFDQIHFQYQSDMPEPQRNQVKLTIDQTKIEVNGQTQAIDQAPVIVSGNTLVPLRFVTEAIGGHVEWNDEERRVTVTRNGQLMDFWLGQIDYIADGTRKSAEVSPELHNERTMVPLRVLSEHFGWKVSWDQETRTVTLE